ncbi:MAG TPA: aldo/keto reductase [Acidobacteriota bacterium]|jgi:aryl-alcohol dehydrogenase-like predicted oxidoreductase
MNYRTLGRTGLRVSEIGFGCWAIGGPYKIKGIPIGWGPVDDRQSLQAIARALDLGVNFFDTADSYGFGHSETILGQALAGKRPSVIIASKVGNVALPDRPHRKDSSASHILQTCERSLQRLKTDYLDLYQLHNPPMEKLWSSDAPEALARLQSEGKIRHYGVSISHPSEGEQIIEKNFGSTLQVLFNVLNQKPADGLFGLARRSNYGIIARVPLASALLTGKIRSFDFHPQDNRNNFLSPKRLQDVLPKVDRYLELCQGHRLKPVPAALQFVLAHPAVSTAIPGAKTEQQVSENVSAGAARLPPSLLQSLREEFRGYNFYLRYGIPI